MAVLQGSRGRRILIVTGVAALLGAGGAGAAYATSDGAAPAETGFAVVDTAPGGTPAEQECDEAKARAEGSAPSGDAPAQDEGRL
jgi:hypothetical protein